MKEIVRKSIEELNSLLPKEKKLEIKDSTPLVGTKSVLESIDIVNLFVNLDKNLKEKKDFTLSFNEIENLIYPYGYKIFALTNHHSSDQHSTNIIVQPNLQFDVIYTRDEIYKEYAYGRNFFEKSMYRKPSRTIEEYMQDKLTRK